MKKAIKLFILFVIISSGLICFSGGFVSADELEPLFPGYPTVFDMKGEVDNLNSEMVVINDSAYGLSPSVSFHGPNGGSGIVLKAKVGGIFDTDGLVVSLWLIEKSSQRSKGEGNSFNSQQRKNGSKIFKENGIWKN